MKKRFSLLVLTVLVAAFSLMSLRAQDAVTATRGPITQAIIDRGVLKCGVNAELTGFGVAVGDTYEGFDIDFCKAVAAAVLGDATKVEYRPLKAAERQAAIQTGEIDMMSRNTTFTLSRDMTWGATFGPTTFYDGQGIMVRADAGIASIADLNGKIICVQSGTTTELNLADYMRANNVAYEPKVFAEANPTWETYLQGGCDAFTTDKSGLVSYRTRAEDPGAHLILPETLSKEPLGPLSPQSDPQFAEIIAWTVWGTIQAEEFGINSQNIGDFLQNEGESNEDYKVRIKPEIARFLGQGGENSGNNLGIANDFMVAVVTQVGNYSEIYDRHITPLGLNRAGTLNDLWTRGGMLYSPPFR
jgi:general L-amino acid transport system substrate-binding protein